MKLKKILRKLGGRSRTATRRNCPICSWSGRQFATGGASHKARLDCRCPNCGSSERHRLAYLVASTRVELDYSSVLHVAPERELQKFIQGRSADYLSIDLYKPAMAKMDVTALDLPDGSKTLVWISHVLEHVERDDLAIAEIHRVLKPGGVAFVQVPIWREKTFEDFSVRTPEGRLKAFYQTDHVRLYGLDIAERFERAGFESTIFRAQDFGPEKLLLHGLSFASTNEVFVFRKK
jgi:SAM-dependent methyltransferase